MSLNIIHSNTIHSNTAIKVTTKRTSLTKSCFNCVNHKKTFKLAPKTPKECRNHFEAHSIGKKRFVHSLNVLSRKVASDSAIKNVRKRFRDPENIRKAHLITRIGSEADKSDKSEGLGSTPEEATNVSSYLL